MKTFDVKLPHGLDIGGKRYREFQLREAVVRDMIDAEDMVPGAGEIKYSTALLTLQIQRVRDKGAEFEGDLTMSMLGGLTPIDFVELRKGQTALETMALDDEGTAGDEDIQEKNGMSADAT